MNDDVRFERLFADGLHELAPQRAPDRLRTKVKAETDEVRPRARWLALIKEPPMRTNSRTSVGSPIARVAAIVVATLLAATMLVSAGIAGAQLFAADGPIVVDQSGGGDYTTITEAVAAAEDGDEVLVRPGIYTEAVVIDKDISISGDGPVEDIVVMAPENGPEAETHSSISSEPYAVLLSESSGSLFGLTFRGEPSTIIVSGGSPTIEYNVLDDVAWPFPERGTTQDGGAITVVAGSTARIVENKLHDGGSISVFGEASPTIEGNVLKGGPHIYLREHGADTIVRGNRISDTLSRAIAVSGPAPVLIEANYISDAGDVGIRVGRNSGAEGFEPIINENIIEGTRSGIAVTRAGAPHVEGNTVMNNRVGISAGDSTGTYADNVIRNNDVGFSASGSQTGPTLTGNTICDNEVNLSLADAVPPLDWDDSNEICEDAPAA